VNNCDDGEQPARVGLKLSSDTGSRTSEPEPGRNWLVQAKADVNSLKEVALVNRCGLVDTVETGPKAVLDQVRVFDSGEDIALSAVVTKAAGNPTIAALHIAGGHRRRQGHPAGREDDGAGGGRRHRTMSPVMALAGLR